MNLSQLLLTMLICSQGMRKSVPNAVGTLSGESVTKGCYHQGLPVPFQLAMIKNLPHECSGFSHNRRLSRHLSYGIKTHRYIAR